MIHEANIRQSRQCSPNRIQNNDVADRAGRGKKTKKRNKRQREREKRKPFPPRRKDEKEETQHVDRWFLASGRGRRRGWRETRLG